MDDIFSYILQFGVIAVITGVCALCTYLFGTIGILIGGLICLDIYISLAFLFVIKEQIYITKLHKKGYRTNGTLTNVVYGVRDGHNYISY